MAFVESYSCLINSLPQTVIDADDLYCFNSPVFQASVCTLASKCMLDHEFKALPSSAIATGILYFIRESTNIEPVWCPSLSRITGHDAPTSKSVQRVLQLLDNMTQEENQHQPAYTEEREVLEETPASRDQVEYEDEHEAQEVEEECEDSRDESDCMEDELNESDASALLDNSNAEHPRHLSIVSNKQLQPNGDYCTPAVNKINPDAADKTDFSPVAIADYGV